VDRRPPEWRNQQEEAEDSKRGRAEGRDITVEVDDACAGGWGVVYTRWRGKRGRTDKAVYQMTVLPLSDTTTVEWALDTCRTLQREYLLFWVQ
jgi:hypothetical protein